MAIQYINTGSSANAGNGDSLRSAFIKVNNNFAYLSTATSGGGNGYTGSIGYTGSQGNIGYTGSAGVGTVTAGNAGRFALYFSSGTVVSQNSILTLSTATVYVGQEFGASSFWLQREVYSGLFGQGFTYSQHHEVSDAMNFNFYRTRGTAAAPTAVQNADELGEIVFFGYNGSAVASGGGFTYHVDGNITVGRIPTKLSVSTTNPSFSTPIVGAELSSSSTWKIFRLGHLSTTTTSITVAANLVPDQDSVRSLGSSLNQWRSLYVSSSTIYINRTPLTIDDAGTLLVNGSSILGTPGYTGSRGNLGYTGSRGNTGYDGSQGAIGYSGSKGDLGYTGSKGDTGYAGSKGDIGYTGSEGSPGLQGNRGYTGSEGLQGTPGLQGLTGAQGINIVLVGSTTTVTTSTVGLGTAGQGWINTTDGDVYFWNTGTQLWENIGPIVGPQGDLGYTGSQGTQGDIGLTGDTGFTGSQGANGYDGSQGETGYTGSQGELGYTGSQGDVGYTGSTGGRGFQGYTGSEGFVGSQGNLGFTGSRGLTGFTGSQGTLGYTGSAGAGYTGSKGDPGEPGGNANTGNFVFTASQVSVSNDGDITLVTNANTWTFGTDGVLTLPGGNTRIGDVYGAGNDVIAGSTGTAVGVLTQGTGGYAALQWIGDTTTSTTNAAAVIVNSPFSASSGTVQIVTGAVTGPTAENTWEFGADGVLTAPGHLLPNADLAYDLGSTTTQWRSIYVGTGTIFIGGVALGVNQDNYVTVDGNPIITVNTAGNFTVQGDTNIVLGAVVISDTAPAATTPGSQWYNSVDGRTYVAYNGAWVDASPTVVPAPGTYLQDITIDGSTLNINGSTLTISNTGTLLVNGSEVTGSGTGSSTHIEYTDGQSQYTSTVDLGYNFEVDTHYAHLDINGDGTWEIGSNAFDTKIFSTMDPGNEPTVIVVRAGDEDWTFGPLGWFTLPGGSVIKDGMGAIRLEPSGASSSTQALLVYPTAQDGNHIHLIAGGGETDLYLGSDSQYVKVDHSGTIVVGTLGANTSTWTFGTDGVLTLSTASTILGNSSDPNVYIETLTTSTTNTWTFAADGSLTFPDNTVQTTAYPTGQQTVLVNAASTGTAIELTELIGTVIWVDAEPSYNVPSETHYLVLPYQDNPVNPNIPLGTRITVINNYSGTVAVRGWPGGPFSEYQMANGESIDLVYHYNFNYGGNLWWITNTFNW